MALERRENGTVRVTVAVDAAGKPTGSSVVQSSAFYALNNGTCLTMKKAGRFAPATRGEPGSQPVKIRRWTSPPVVWEPR